MYEDSDVSEGIGSCCTGLPALRLLSSLPILDDLPGEPSNWLFSALMVRLLEVVEALSPDLGLTELTGG